MCMYLSEIKTILQFFFLYFCFFLFAWQHIIMTPHVLHLPCLGVCVREDVRKWDCDTQRSVSGQIILCGVGGEGVRVLVVRVITAIISCRLPRQSNACVVVCVDGLAEVDGILQLLLQDQFTGVTRQFEQEEAGVRFWEEVVRWVVLV